MKQSIKLLITLAVTMASSLPTMADHKYTFIEPTTTYQTHDRYVQPTEVCETKRVPIYEEVYHKGDNGESAFLGAVFGAIIGKQITDDAGGTAAGAIIGGVIGDKKGKAHVTRRVIGYTNETHCHTVWEHNEHYHDQPIRHYHERRNNVNYTFTITVRN